MFLICRAIIMVVAEGECADAWDSIVSNVQTFQDVSTLAETAHQQRSVLVVSPSFSNLIFNRSALSCRP